MKYGKRVRFAVLAISMMPVLCLQTPLALADASLGELAGYLLGDRYPVSGGLPAEPQPDGSLRIAAPDPFLPDGFDRVDLYVSPASRLIGKIIVSRRCDDLVTAGQLAEAQKRSLEQQYPEWEVLKAPIPFGKDGGAMVSRLRQLPYALIVFYRADADEARLSVELEYDATSAQRQAWKARLGEEKAAGVTP